jgi:hypothetical protein
VLRVGDGTQINIWLDSWIPNGVTRRPITPRGHTILNKVSDLIDPISSEWDVSLINEIFWEEDVKHILAILLKHGMEDSLAWHFGSKGSFSVKSAYHVLTDRKELSRRRQLGESNTKPNTSCIFKWRQI